MNPVPEPKHLATASAAILFALLAEAILTVWIDNRWAISCFQAGVFLLAAFWALIFVLKPFPLRSHRTLVFLAALPLLGAIQLLRHSTVNRWETTNSTLMWLTYLAAFLIALQLGAIPSVRDRLLLACVAFGFIFSAISLTMFYASPTLVFGVFTPPFPELYLGPFTNRDHYAAFIELLLPIVLYRALSNPKSFYWASAVSAVMFASVIAGASRAGSFLVSAETVGVYLLASRRRLPVARHGSLALVVMLLGIGAFTAAAGWDFLVERIQHAETYEDRGRMLVSAIAMIREKPLSGFGLGSLEDAYPRFAIFDNGEVLGHAHNDWAEWAVTGGIPFTLLVGLIVLFATRPCLRSIWGIGVLSVFAHCLIDFPLQRAPVALWLFTLLGAALGHTTPDTARPR